MGAAHDSEKDREGKEMWIDFGIDRNEAVARYNQNSSVSLAANSALLLFRIHLYHLDKIILK